MKPVVVAATVAGTLACAQLVLFAGVASAPPVLPAPAGGGRPFLIQRIPNGTTLSQSLNVQTNSLDTIELEGAVSGPAQLGSIDATLVELSDDATERHVRLASVRVVDTCCTIAFQPVQDSAARRYRLDLRIRDFGASAPLSLWAVPLDHISGLTVNGRPQAARLELTGSATASTALSRLRGPAARREISLGWLLAFFAVLDAAIACGAAGLVKVFATGPD